MAPIQTRTEQYLNEARLALRPPLSWSLIARRAGISRDTLHRIRREDTKHAVGTAKERSLELVVGWGPGSLAAIRAGGEPTPASQDERHVPRDPTEDQIRRLPHLTTEDIERVLQMYRARRDGPLAVAIYELERMRDLQLEGEDDPEQRERIAQNFDFRIADLKRSAGIPTTDY